MKPKRQKSDLLSAGTRLLDRYAILEPVASGGMSTIYRASDERLERIVCVKVFRPPRAAEEGSSSDPASAEAYRATYSHFLQEALALSRLQHPNTLRIYDFGYLEKGGRPFQVAEYLDGGDLERRVRQTGALSTDEALTVLERITEALGEAHERKIIHRDIKPSNILFSRFGTQLVPKLADFGIALWDRRPASTDGDALVPVGLDPVERWGASELLYSPHWAAPEQIMRRELGPFTDVYSLGLVTLYMLTGESPFGVPDVLSTFLDRVQNNSLIEALIERAGVAPAARPVLLAATHFDRTRRLATAAELFAGLRNALLGPRRELPSVIAMAKGGSVPPPLPVPPRLPALRGPSQLPPARDLGPPQRWPSELPPPPEAASLGRSPLEVPPAGDAWAQRGMAEGRVRLVSDVSGEVTLEPSSEGGQVRLVDVYERLDVETTGENGGALRFRLTLVPAPTGGVRLHVKGLTCFVSKPGARPGPALVSEGDGAAEFVSPARTRVGGCAWWFGRPGPTGLVFYLNRTTPLVIGSEGPCTAVAFRLDQGADLVVLCKRT